MKKNKKSFGGEIFSVFLYILQCHSIKRKNTRKSDNFLFLYFSCVLEQQVTPCFAQWHFSVVIFTNTPDCIGKMLGKTMGKFFQIGDNFLGYKQMNVSNKKQLDFFFQEFWENFPGFVKIQGNSKFLNKLKENSVDENSSFPRNSILNWIFQNEKEKLEISMKILQFSVIFPSSLKKKNHWKFSLWVWDGKFVKMKKKIVERMCFWCCVSCC